MNYQEGFDGSGNDKNTLTSMKMKMKYNETNINVNFNIASTKTFCVILFKTTPYTMRYNGTYNDTSNLTLSDLGVSLLN